jgi:CRP-like cAMP-binding protein
VVAGFTFMNLLDADTVPGRGSVVVGGSYALGVLELLAGAWFVLTLLALGRAGQAAVWKLPPPRLGIALPLPWLVVDDRDEARAGRKGELDILYAGLGLAGIGYGLLDLGAELSGKATPSGQALRLAAWGGLCALWALWSPLGPTPGGRAFDLALPHREGRLDARTYLRSRILRRQGGQPLFDGEGHHLVWVSALVLWLFLGLRGGVSFLAAQAGALAEALLGGASVLDALVAAGVGASAIAAVAACLGLLAWRLAEALRGNLKPATTNLAPLGPDPAGARRALEASPLFAPLDAATTTALAERFQGSAVAPGALVVREGDSGDRLFLVGSGELLVFTTTPAGREQPLATLVAGDCFGEIALLDGGARTASVRAEGPAVVFALERGPFLESLVQAGVAPREVTARLRSTQLVRKSPIFSHLAPPAVAQLAGTLRRREAPAGTVLMREGEPGDTFYLLEAGSLRVDRGAGQAEVARIEPGGFVGEIALIHDVPRTATVTAAEDAVVLTLDRDQFRAVVSSDFAAGVRLEIAATRRLPGAA